MRGKIVSIFLIISIGIFSMITPVNAQNINSIKFYHYDEGIELAKSAGKPIAFNMLLQPLSDRDEKKINEYYGKTLVEMNKFININFTSSYGSTDTFVSVILRSRQQESQMATYLLILDSDGREITRIAGIDMDKNIPLLIRLDSDGKEIGRIPFPKSAKTEIEKLDDFFSETYKYAANKKGKIQRLPQEIGLISVAEYNKNKGVYLYNYTTISGFIRDIKSEGNSYKFGIDDGTGVINLAYGGGLGDIKEGDKVFVKMFISSVLKVSKTPIPTSVNTAKSDETGTTPKTPGFEAMIGAIAMFFAWKKIIGKG